jgi:hypothetical protein
LPLFIDLRFNYFKKNYYNFKPFSKEELTRIHGLLAKIPPYASVAAQDPVIPLLTQRERIYTLDEYRRAEYIPIDLALNFSPLVTRDGAILVRKLMEAPDYQILECTDYSIIFKRGYGSEPKKKCLEFQENLNLLK